MTDENQEQVIQDFVHQELPTIISNLEAKSPTAERFLLEIARRAGLKKAILFDGRTVTLGADESQDVILSDTPPDSDTKGG